VESGKQPATGEQGFSYPPAPDPPSGFSCGTRWQGSCESV